MPDDSDLIVQEIKKLADLNKINFEKIKIQITQPENPHIQSIKDFLLSLETHIQVPKDIIVSDYSIETISPIILKFSFPVESNGAEFNYNIFINHSEAVAPGRFIWDYFGSGECYCNLNLVDLLCAKTSFASVHRQYLSSPKRLGTQPTQVGLTPYAFVMSDYAPNGTIERH